MDQEKSDFCLPVNNSLQIESLPFSEIPGQTKLFIEYQQNPLSLKNYYPNIVASHTEIQTTFRRFWKIIKLTGMRFVMRSRK